MVRTVFVSLLTIDMKRFNDWVFFVVFVVLLTWAVLAMGQSASYIHDPSLDAINRSIITLDSDLNSKNFSNSNSPNGGQGMTIGDAVVFGALTMQGGFSGTFTNQQGQVVAFTNNPSMTASNAFLMAQTNMGALVAAVGSNIVANMTGLGNMSWTNGIGDGQDLGGYYINIVGANVLAKDASAINLNLALSGVTPTLSSTGTNLRFLILCIFSLMCLVWSLQYITTELPKVLAQGQIKGMNQEVMGTNVVVPTALIFVAVITASLSTLIGFFAGTADGGFLGSLMGSSSGSGGALSVGTAIHTFSLAQPAWDTLTSFCPVVGILIVFVNYLMFRYVYAWPLFFTALGLKMFLFS